MSLVSRSLTTGIVGLALVGLSACSGGAPGGTEPGTPAPETQASGLANFDPCTFMTPDELNAAGVDPSSKREATATNDQPGCDWEGEKVLLTLSKNEKQNFERYSQNNFETFEPFDINGRKAARAVTAGSGGQGICSAIVSAGGGIVDVNVAGIMRDSVADPCAEAEKVARQIEPRLPK